MLLDGHQNFDDHPDLFLAIDVHVLGVAMQNASRLLNFGDFCRVTVRTKCIRIGRGGEGQMRGVRVRTL